MTHCNAVLDAGGEGIWCDRREHADEWHEAYVPVDVGFVVLRWRENPLLILRCGDWEEDHGA